MEGRNNGPFEVSMPACVKGSERFQIGSLCSKKECVAFCVRYFKLVGMFCFILRSVGLFERLDNDHATEDVWTRSMTDRYEK